MSSRGTRVAGSDGTDFTHREIIPSRFKQSVAYKKNLRNAILLHLLLLMVMMLKLSDNVLERLNILIPSLAELDVPKPFWFEYPWLLSLVPSLCGLLSLSRNNLIFLYLCFYGTLAVGVVPVVGGLGYLSSDMLRYIQHRSTKTLFLGLPVVTLWFAFLTAALQVHLFSLYYAHQLKKSWDKGTKAK